MKPFRVIGTRVAKLDAADKDTGAVQYLPDLEVPGMAWGKILRTPVPHARIRRIDTRRAEALPGVLGVVTGRNVEQRPFGYAKDHLALKPDVASAVAGADGVVLVTEWRDIVGADWADVRDRMRTPVLIDGRNALDPARMTALGFAFEGIGRIPEHVGVTL